MEHSQANIQEIITQRVLRRFIRKGEIDGKVDLLINHHIDFMNKKKLD